MGVNLANDDQLRALAEQVNAAVTGTGAPRRWCRAPARPGRTSP